MLLPSYVVACRLALLGVWVFPRVYRAISRVIVVEYTTYSSTEMDISHFWLSCMSSSSEDPLILHGGWDAGLTFGIEETQPNEFRVRSK